MFMRKKMRDYLAQNYSASSEPTLVELLAQKLITDKEAETIRNDGRGVLADWQ